MSSRTLNLFLSLEAVSPNTYFAFTPLLAGASVGTVDFNSTLEPVRRYPDVVRRFRSFSVPLKVVLP